MKQALDCDMAAETQEVCTNGFSIGEISVRLAGDDQSAVALSELLLPFQTDASHCDVDLHVTWVDRLITPAGRKLFDSGALWRLYETDSGFEFDFVAPIFGDLPYKRLLTDREFSRATLEMTRAAVNAVPEAAPLDYPVDELLIMHRLTREKAIELHSCGIRKADGVGNLFVGHSGAGKSTTTRLWMERAGVEVLSDDRIIVRQDASVVETPCEARGRAREHRVLRLRDCSASWTNLSAQDDNEIGAPRNQKTMRMYGTPWHGEGMYASPNSAVLTRIFILEHGHGNVLTRLSPNQAVAELFARSFVPFHRHEYVESALEFLQEVVDSVPCYHYAFEPNPSAVDTILNFHD